MPYHNKSCNCFIVGTVTLVTTVFWWKLCNGKTVNCIFLSLFSLSVSFAAEAIDSDPSRYVFYPICLSLAMCCSHSHVLKTLAAIQQTSARVSWLTVFACSAEIKMAPFRNLTISLNDSSDRANHNQFHNEAKTSHCGINRVCIDPKLCACSRVRFRCAVVSVLCELLLC